LRADPVLRARYAELKLELAGAGATDRAAYGERKTAFIARVVSSITAHREPHTHDSCR
jgi:GrpB-like predicted nucleotidyltransferase (UPF0157 family)